MSELKVYVMPLKTNIFGRTIVGQSYYSKAETDKVFAEQDAKIAELKKERDWLAKDRAQAYDDLEKRAQLNIKQEESIRHHKYKRCLAMAKLAVEDDYAPWNMKWRKRWLELAEKFKEAK